MDVGHPVAVNQIEVSADLDADGAGIDIPLQAEIEPPAFALPAGPELPLGVIEVVGLVLEVVAAELDDLVAPGGAPPAPEA